MNNDIIFHLAYDLYREEEAKLAFKNNIKEYAIYNEYVFRHDKTLNYNFIRKVNIKLRKNKINNIINE